MDMTPEMEARALASAARKLHLGDYHRHILLCVGGDCASREDQDAAWQFLKRRLAELGLVDVDGAVFRSKVECLRVCLSGPVAGGATEAVYDVCDYGANPNGQRRCTEAIQKAIFGGEPQEEKRGKKPKRKPRSRRAKRRS